MNLLFGAVSGIAQLLDGISRRSLHCEPDYGDPEPAVLRDALSACDYATVEDLLAQHQSDFSRRFFLASAATQISREPAWLTDWPQQSPNSPAAHLMCGAAWMHFAWNARGAGYNQTVSEAGAQLFLERLRKSLAILTRATQLAPRDPTAWALLIRVGRGLGAPPAMVGQWLDRAIAIDPHHYFAHHEMLQFKCAKWYGSNTEMWEFARSAEEAAPPGSPVCSLVAVAHFEHAIALAGEDDARSPDQVERVYWSQAHVLSTTVKAFRKLQTGARAASPDRRCALGEFAFALWRCGAREPAREAFDELGAHLIGTNWNSDMMPARRFRKARRACGAA